MSQRQLAQFQAKVSQCSALQEQLKGAADQKQFIQLMVKLGSENNNHFSPIDVEEFIAKSHEPAHQNAITVEFPMESLDVVSCGTSVKKHISNMLVQPTTRKFLLVRDAATVSAQASA